MDPIRQAFEDLIDPDRYSLAWDAATACYSDGRTIEVYGVFLRGANWGMGRAMDALRMKVDEVKTAASGTDGNDEGA